MSQPDLRVSDIERDRVGELLREAYADGWLALEEFNERMEAALSAKTRGDLAGLTQDLVPDSTPTLVPEPSRQMSKSSGATKRWMVSVLGDSKHSGIWHPAAEINAVAALGDVKLDLRQASLIEGQLTVQAIAIMGDVEILIAPGTRVELDGLALLGDKEIRLREDNVAPNGRTVHVHGYSIMGDVTIASNEDDLKSRAWRRYQRRLRS